MAKLKGPLFSFGASGSIGPRLTYSQRKSGPQVRFQKAQPDHNTAAQQTQRGFFQTAVSWWHELTGTEQDSWG